MSPRKKAAPGASVLSKLRKICLALPDTRETLTWGEPHFRVGDKIFCGCGEEDGRTVIGMKLEKEHADTIVQDPRFRRAPYVGKHGWVSMDASQIDDWDTVRALVLESYGLIAPKRSLAELASGDAAPARPPRSRARAARKRPRRRRAA